MNPVAEVAKKADVGPWRASPALPAEFPAGYNSCVPNTATNIHVKVLFFGRLKEIAGQSEESIEISQGATLEELFALCSSRRPELARFRSSLVASRNQEFVLWAATLHAGDEVAFLPPVSGG